MEKKITSTSTKNDILEAYNELLAKIQSEQTLQPKETKEREDKAQVVKSASGITPEGIAKNLSVLKLSLSNSLDEIEEKLSTEYKKLSQVQEAIRIEKVRLEELYQVNANADSLAAMLSAYKEKKLQLENEYAKQKAEIEADIAEKKQQLEKDKKELQQRIKEQEEHIQKTRKREEEEYQYNLQLSRKKESDQYEQKKIAMEKALTNKQTEVEDSIIKREKAMTASENELSELRKKAEAFPSELDKAVKLAIKEPTEKLETNYKHENQLKAKEIEGETKLKNQIIENLHSRIKDLELHLKQQAQKIEEAEKNVKDITIKAIESSASIRLVEKAKDDSSK